MPVKSPLYERDFYAWSREQADLLRAGKLSEADIEHIAEEIDSMGRTEKRELISRLDVLLLHLLKWRYQPGKRGSSWEASISNRRDDIADHLDDNPSLKPLLPQTLASAYRKACREAVAETGLAGSIFTESCPCGRWSRCWTAGSGRGDKLMSEPPNSPEVQVFMALFHKLRDAVNGGPKAVFPLASEDDALVFWH